MNIVTPSEIPNSVPSSTAVPKHHHPVPKMSECEDESIDESPDAAKFTHEQKIVAAVWVHEREFNHQTWKDIKSNFLARFQMQPPNRSTLLNWERKLFSQGNVEDKEKVGRPMARLMHVPYVRASIKEQPDLSLRERAKLLGLSRTTLLKILKEDLNMEFEVKADDSNMSLKRRHAPYGGGQWKKKKSEESEEFPSFEQAVGEGFVPNQI